MNKKTVVVILGLLLIISVMGCSKEMKKVEKPTGDQRVDQNTVVEDQNTNVEKTDDSTNTDSKTPEETGDESLTEEIPELDEEETVDDTAETFDQLETDIDEMFA